MKHLKLIFAISILSTFLFSCTPKKEDVPQPIVTSSSSSAMNIQLSNNLTDGIWVYDSTVLFDKNESVITSGVEDRGHYTISYNKNESITCILPSGKTDDYFINQKWKISENSDTLTLSKDCNPVAKSLIKKLTKSQMIIVQIDGSSSKLTSYFSKVKK